mmetsp:Transcript_7994/g.18029  ORF Transcript_7994/g.18029 Transcript_7994/m.18029 type:complete len:135 (-) Transcript_7994:611-1015(-)
MHLKDGGCTLLQSDSKLGGVSRRAYSVSNADWCDGGEDGDDVKLVWDQNGQYEYSIGRSISTYLDTHCDIIQCPIRWWCLPRRLAFATALGSDQLSPPQPTMLDSSITIPHIPILTQHNTLCLQRRLHNNVPYQ